MNKIERLEKLLDRAQGFIGKNITCSDSKFEAWNNSLLRFIDSYSYSHLSKMLHRSSSVMATI